MANSRQVGLWIAFLTLLFFCAGCNLAPSTADIPAVRRFSLEKYLGTWYEIARLPHRFERNLSSVKAQYILQIDGKVKVVNSGTKNGVLQTAEGIAVMKETADTGELRVSFFRPFFGDYRIIYLTSDYTVAMVTSATRDYLWILARSSEIDTAQLRQCIELAKKWNFPVELLQYPQCGIPVGCGRSKNGGGQ